MEQVIQLLTGSYIYTCICFHCRYTTHENHIILFVPFCACALYFTSFCCRFLFFFGISLCMFCQLCIGVCHQFASNHMQSNTFSNRADEQKKQPNNNSNDTSKLMQIYAIRIYLARFSLNSYYIVPCRGSY